MKHIKENLNTLFACIVIRIYNYDIKITEVYYPVKLFF